MRKTSLSILFLITLLSYSQNKIVLFCEGYNSSIGWKTVGSGISFSNSQLIATNLATDLSPKRVFKKLPTAIEKDKDWIIETVFTDLTKSNESASIDLLALTADSTDPQLACNTGTCQNVLTTKKNIVVFTTRFLEAGFPQTNKILAYLRITGAPTLNQSTGIEITSGETYYLNVEKQGRNYKLSIFSDFERTVHISGSPINITAGYDLDDLNYIQHGASTAAGSFRKANFTIDETCISEIEVTSILKHNTNLTSQKISISPNPTSGITTVKIDGQTPDKIEIFNQLGNSILSFSNQENIDLSILKSGVYMLIAFENGNVYSSKVMVQ